jgi:hypothetical protein
MVIMCHLNGDITAANPAFIRSTFDEARLAVCNPAPTAQIDGHNMSQFTDAARHFDIKRY